VEVSFLPFFLRPDMPKEGKSKGGTAESRVGDWLKKINQAEGPAIEFTGKCDRYPNTEKYQIAMAYLLKEHGAELQSAASARCFKGYYHDGIYPDTAGLVSLCGEGIPALDKDVFRAELEDPSALAKVQDRAKELRREFGVTGVPFFLIDDGAGSKRKATLSGAQEAESFVDAFARA